MIDPRNNRPRSIFSNIGGRGNNQPGPTRIDLPTDPNRPESRPQIGYFFCTIRYPREDIWVFNNQTTRVAFFRFQRMEK